MPTGSDRERKAQDDRTMTAGWALMAVGWELVSEVVAGLLIGWGIDYAFDVEPWGIVGGTIAGLLVGIWTFIRRALAIERSLGPVRRPPGGWKGERPDENERPPEDPEGPS